MTNRFGQRTFRIAFLFTIISLGACSSNPGKSYSSKPHVKSEKIVRVAESMIGRPYKYGGKSPRNGFDCSGLVYYSHLKNGIDLPRTSYAQYKATQPVPRKALRRGDLLFFRVSSRKVSHVGIYLGDNLFVHAPSSGKEVSVAELDSPYWSKRFIRGGRIVL